MNWEKRELKAVKIFEIFLDSEKNLHLWTFEMHEMWSRVMIRLSRADHNTNRFPNWSPIYNKDWLSSFIIVSTRLRLKIFICVIIFTIVEKNRCQ